MKTRRIKIMAIRKPCKTYYFSVEGETENWYLQWLQDIINNCESVHHRVSLKSKVQKDPLSYVKSVTLMPNETIYHFFDYESSEPVHTDNFKRTIDRMREAERQKRIRYKFCYSNFTFDLWIILHKTDCKTSLNHRRQYIEYINQAFAVSYTDMNEYKHEDNFKSLLSKCTLDDVVEAINRAKRIDKLHQEHGHTQLTYKHEKYYIDNPSTTVWQSIETVLKKCGYIKTISRKR